MSTWNEGEERVKERTERREERGERREEREMKTCSRTGAVKKAAFSLRVK
jgi:hypothetical protein